MTYRHSGLDELAAARHRGQAPDGFVVIGEGEAREWCERNRFFFVDSRDLTDETLAFSGLYVVIRSRKLHAGYPIVQAIALRALMVTVFDLQTLTSEFLALAEAA